MMVLGLMQNDSIEQVLKIHYVCPSIRKGHESYWDDRPICFSIINVSIFKESNIRNTYIGRGERNEV